VHLHPLVVLEALGGTPGKRHRHVTAKSSGPRWLGVWASVLNGVRSAPMWWVVLMVVVRPHPYFLVAP
jgi:hypothetical protein